MFNAGAGPVDPHNHPSPDADRRQPSQVEHPLSGSERGAGGEVPERTATRLTHIVVMGMGEPLANLDNLLAALAVAGDKDGLGIGQRHVTISTVGLPAKIRALADKDLQYHLAISLHAPNDPLRTEIVPTNSKTGIPDILAAADYFFERTGRQVTYEYVVLGKQNDQSQHARQLVGLLKGRKAHVNLIPWNDVPGLPFRRPTDDDLRGFIDTVRKAGISVKVRKRKGADIDAACGQLRRSAEAGMGYGVSGGNRGTGSGAKPSAPPEDGIAAGAYPIPDTPYPNP